MNKIDLLEAPRPGLERDAQGAPRAVHVSARDRLGLEGIGEALAARIGAAVRARAWLRPEQGRLRARLYAAGWVEDERVDERGTQELALHLPAAELERLADAGALVERVAAADAEPVEGRVAASGAAP